MAKQQLSLFDVEGVEPPREKAPTLRQYLKEQKNVTYPLYSTIRTIWYPGNWDNYSIECDSFRVSITPKHPIYAVLDKVVVKTFTESQTAILLCVRDERGTIGFGESTLYGEYVRIGDVGLRFDETRQTPN